MAACRGPARVRSMTDRRPRRHREPSRRSPTAHRKQLLGARSAATVVAHNEGQIESSPTTSARSESSAEDPRFRDLGSSVFRLLGFVSHATVRSRCPGHRPINRRQEPPRFGSIGGPVWCHGSEDPPKRDMTSTSPLQSTSQREKGSTVAMDPRHRLCANPDCRHLRRDHLSSPSLTMVTACLECRCLSFWPEADGDDAGAAELEDLAHA